jgi:signal transduction histidine kinase
VSSNQEEVERLFALAKCRILDSDAEETFDELVELAARSASCPMAMLSFVDRDRVWLKAALGVARHDFPRAGSPCDVALTLPLLVVGDTARDARFAAHPLVSEPPNARFYAGAPIHSPDGEPVGVLSVLDTKPRELAAAEARALSALARIASGKLELRLLRDARLLKSEALLSSAQRIAGIGSWEWDMRTNEIAWSDEMYTIFNRARDFVPDLEGFLNCVHPDEREAMKAKVAQTISEGRTTFPEYRIVWPDGTVRMIAVCAEVERDRVGAPTRLIGALQDVTDQRRLELERQQIAKQMLRAQKLESLGVLAAGIAHDFNNLLVGIVGNASLAAADRKLSVATKELLEQLLDAASQAAGLTRQLLAYTGRRPFAMREIGLAAHVSSLGSLLRASLSKGIKLRLELEPELPLVCADIDQLQQVTMNLILNAAEAYGDGQGEVFVRTFAEELERPHVHALTVPAPPGPGRYVVFEVSDSGCGMDSGTLERIFEPFFSTKFTGRGLGLAAVLGIVRGHDAVLSVDSALGEGTTFRVYFPAVVQPSANAPRAEASRSSEPHGDALQNLGVLVVDDEARVRGVVRAVLEGAQMRVIEAQDGEQALALFERRGSDVDVVLLDVIMPGPDVATVLRKLRAERPALPVVLCSGYPEDDAMRLLRELDGERSAFLEKPFSPLGLLEKLRGVLVPQSLAGAGKEPNVREAAPHAS